ncbi:Mannitol repressor [Bacillus sp. bc15]|uniref:MltR family transcriptional regulator n=1 Tax=Bacillus TaxID=1386 RepID=UPI00091E2B11|nr:MULTISPECIES: MltR family transcriptional regulator [Bacillus]PGW74493.1 transcriptional regulator [Bacillus thuringiensis]SHL25485.1 Mannitol repressor [Bacillus sp. bc15]
MRNKKGNDFYERVIKNKEYLGAYEEFEKELKNSSDRGLVLVCGSIIDQLLSELLKIILIKTDSVEKDLFKGNGVLTNFDSKIKMSYYLGLISQNERLNIIYLQRIRNKFAHQFVDISFENNDIINVCKNFGIPKNCFVPPSIPFPNEETGELPPLELNPIRKDTSAKNRFIFTFRYIYYTLINRIFLDEFESREEYKKVITVENITLKQIQLIEGALSVCKDNVFIMRDDLEKMKDNFEGLQGDIDKIKKEHNNSFTQDIQDEIKKVEIGVKKLAKKYEESAKEYEESVKEYEERSKHFNAFLNNLRYSYDVLKNSIKE